MNDDFEGEDSIKHLFENAKKDVESLGGWSSFKSGDWLFKLIQKSFRNYFERANAEYFKEKYASEDTEVISKKLISVAARNASILGVVVGATVSADEIIVLLTGGEGGFGIPANIAIAGVAVSAECVVLLKMQLQLVANLAKLQGVPLDPDDPEDILTILAFAVGGSVADAAGKAGMKVGGKVSEKMIRKYITKETLEAIKAIGRKIGVKILQRTIIKYTVPVVSMGIGGGWNYFTTKKIGRITQKHLKSRVSTK